MCVCVLQVQAHGKGDFSKSGILVNAEKGSFGIVGNALTVLERTAQSEIPTLSEKVADTLSVRSGQVFSSLGSGLLG